ncbi:MAG TPA: Ig-like domain-containing protein [Puia sp.]|nr:Ig-like domain-containing protein [Puia sp.]
MVPQIENRVPFTGVMLRHGRVLMLGILLFGLRVTGYGQIPANWTVTIVTSPNNQPADGTSNDVCTVTIMDNSTIPATPVNGVTVDFTINPTTVTSSLVTGSGSFAAGTVQYGLSSTIIQVAQIDIKINGVSFPTQLFRYVAGPPVLNPPAGSPNPSYFIVTGNDAGADNADTNGIQIHVTDANGNDYPQGTPVTITITSNTPASGDVGWRPGVVTKVYNSTIGPDGTVDLPMVDGIAGNVTMTASVEDVNNGNTWYTFPNPVTVTWTSPDADPAASSYTTIIGSAPDDGTDTAVVQVHLVAPGGGPVAANTMVYFTVTSTGPASNNAQLNLTTTSTFSEQIGNFLADGNTIDLPVTDLSAGSVTITASVMVGGVLTPISGSPQTVTFTSGPPAINQTNNPSAFITITNNQPADGSSQDVVQVWLADAGGSGVPNWPVTFTITSNNAASTSALFDPPPSGTPTSTTVTVNTSGNLAASGPGYVVLPLTDLQVGSVTITATFTVGGVTYTIPVDQTVNFVTGSPVNSNPGNPTPPGGGGGSGGSGTGPSNPSNPSGPGGGYTYLSMTYNDVPADGVSTDTATAYVTDAEGHPVSDVMVIFTLHPGGPANSGALFQPQAEIQDTVYTNSNGFAAMAISDTIPGDAWVDASIIVSGTLSDIAGSSAIAVFTPAPDVNNANTQLIVLVYEATADGSSTTQVEAHIVDGSGNPVTNASVTFAIDSGSAQIVGSQTVTTDANGNAIISLTSTTAGYALVTATVNGKAIIYGSPARVYFSTINIYVPRAFSPNNDGTNDLLKPILVGIADFHYFTVYNRWGNIVFTTTDPNQGWDGTLKGVPQPIETYLWIAEGIDTNGKKIVAKGMVSLVR